MTEYTYYSVIKKLVNKCLLLSAKVVTDFPKFEPSYFVLIQCNKNR